jgi:FeS assembly SUF system protein
MSEANLLQIESAIVEALKTVYDPEIPVNVYDLGLIYDIDVNDKNDVAIKMTLTAPNCPMADDVMRDVQEKIKSVAGVNEVDVNLVFDPPWHKDLMSEEAMLQLGFL